jgi:hypothetical protein
MTELDWHNVTSQEAEAAGYEYVLDVSPDVVPDQAAEYNGALVRTMRPGWAWWARPTSASKNRAFGDIGTSDTKEEALRDGMAALDRIRARSE